MRSIRWGAFALLAFACAAHAGVNSWSARGPYGGRVAHLAIDPSNTAVVYAAVDYALFKSTDGGAHWAEAPWNFGQYSIVDMSFDPSNPARVYIASSGGGVFRSTDGGASFSRISAAPTDANVDGPRRLAISADGSALYYTTGSGQFFRSLDGGASFNTGANTTGSLFDLIVDPSNSQTLYASGTELLKSTNGGTSWQALTMPTALTINIHGIALVPGSPATLWVADSLNVYSTQNDGVAWTPASPSLGSRSLFQDVNAPGHLFAPPNFAAGLLRHLTAGTWPSLGNPLPVGVIDLVASPGNSQVLLAATSSGIYRNLDAGGTPWSRSDDGLTAVKVEALTSTAGHIYAGTEHGEIGVAADDDVLQRKVVRDAFTTALNRAQVESIAVRPSNPDFIITGFNGAGYRYSTNGGDTWQDGSSSLDNAWMDAIAIDPTNELLVYAAVRPSALPAPEKLQRSVDGGVTFGPLVSNVGNIWAKKLVADPQNAGRLFLMSSQALNPGDVVGLLRSDDLGITWTKIQSFTSDFVLDPTDSKRIYGADGARFLVSEDSGATFTTASTLGSLAQGFPSIMSIAVDPAVTRVVYAVAVKYTGPPASAVPELFVMRSVDRGSTWERAPNATHANWFPWRLAINSARPTTLVAGTFASGVYSFQFAPDLAASIDGHSGTRPIGVQSSYDVRAENKGPFAATNVVLTSAFPIGAQNVSASIPNGTCVVAVATVQCTLPSLALNATASARVSYTPPTAGALNVNGSVTAREADPDASNNAAGASAAAAETADLVVTGSASPPALDRGNALTYTFQARNAGPNTSSATRLTVTAASGVTVTSASPSTCAVSGGTVVCELGSLASNATTSVTVSATATVAGTLRTTGTATTPGVDPDASNSVANVDILSRDPSASSGGGGGGGGGALSLESLLALATIALLSARRRRSLRPE